MTTHDFTPSVLGKQATSNPDGQIDLIPWTHEARPVVTLQCTEFTSRCPVTGQPDFGEFEIKYVPEGHIVETKSLKLYMQSFRERPEFNERLVVEIGQYIWDTLKPRWLMVTGSFNARGGICPGATYENGRQQG